MLHSRMWHAAFEQVQFGRVPVVAVLHGAVVGGGLELASACHIRVAETSTFYGLPEGQRGLFVGGGGSVRVPRLIGVARMTDMMLTGRVLDADEGERVGLVAVPGAPTAQASPRRIELAKRIAANAPLSNFAVMHALPRIADQSQTDGLFTESLMAAIAQGDAATPSSACAPSSKAAPARWRSREHDAPRGRGRTDVPRRACRRLRRGDARDARRRQRYVLRSTEPLRAVSARA